MKRLVIIVLGFSFIMACSNKEQPVPVQEVEQTGNLVEKGIKEKPLEERMEEHVKNELASGEQNDTIVLDFLFGMTKREVYKHTKALYSKKKMYPIQKSKKVREYVYDLRLRKAGRIRTFFEAYYYDNKQLKKEELYRVECLPKIDTTQLNPKEVLEEIKPIFEMEYGSFDFVIPNPEDENCKTYLWINGNQKIELGCHEEKIFMYYTDIPVERLAAKASDL